MLADIAKDPTVSPWILILLGVVSAAIMVAAAGMCFVIFPHAYSSYKNIVFIRRLLTKLHNEYNGFYIPDESNIADDILRRLVIIGEHYEKAMIEISRAKRIFLLQAGTMIALGLLAVVAGCMLFWSVFALL